MKSFLFQFFENYPVIKELLDHIDNCVHIVDEEGRYVFINRATEKTEGLRNEKICGKKPDELYESRSMLMTVLKTKKKVDECIIRYVMNGKEITHLAMAQPIMINNRLAGACCIQKDITSFEETLLKNMKFQSDDAILTMAHTSDAIFSSLIGESDELEKCRQMALAASKSNSPVMITGATGTGKEVFAKAIHQSSNRKHKPFLAINCAAVPEALLESLLFGTEKGAYTGAIARKGIFEQADGGTLFLDEINSMPLVSQAKLLRVLEEKKVRHLAGDSDVQVNVRIISSSNVSPSKALSEKQIRSDLFYRLSVLNIFLPSLSQRKSDIPILSNHFITLLNEDMHKKVEGLSKEVEDFFLSYHWPGNVRQLKHCIESAMNFITHEETRIMQNHLPHYLFEDNNTIQDIPPSITYGIDSPSSLIEQFAEKLPDMTKEVVSEPPLHENSTPSDIFERINNRQRDSIIAALDSTNGNISQAAKKMGISKQTLSYRMKKYGIRKPKG